MKYKIMVAMFLLMVTVGAGFAVSSVAAWIPTVLIVGGICGLVYALISAMIEYS